MKSRQSGHRPTSDPHSGNGYIDYFCAIAVTTVNKYDKINDFVQAAVHTGEMMEESAEMNERTGEMAETKKN